MEEIRITAKQARQLICQSFHQVSTPLMSAFGVDVAVWVADILSRMNYFEDRHMLDDEGFFFCNQEEIEKVTSLSVFRQNKVIDFLKNLSILEVKKRGLPARLHYKIDYQNLINLTSKAVDDLKILNDCFKNFENSDSKISSNNKTIINKTKEKEIVSKETIKDSAESCVLTPSEFSDKKINRESYKTSYEGSAKAPLSETKPNPEVQSLIEFWEACGLRKTRFGNKTYRENVKQLRSLLRGTFFNKGPLSKDYSGNKFTITEVKSAIKRFSLAALDPDYEPTNGYKERLKGYSIGQFLYNPMVENGDKSLLLKYLKTSPLKASQTIKVKKVPPKVETTANIFRSFYLEKVRGGMHLKVTPQDENNFRDGAVKLYNFSIDNSRQIRGVDDIEIAKWLCEAIWEWARQDPAHITSAKFKSDHTFNILLPSKLMNLGVVEERGY